MSGYSIPQASEDSVKNTVIGYERASTAGGEVSVEKAAEGADVSKDVVRRQRSFFAEIGILKESDSGYDLTDTGREIGRALRHERDDDAREPFGGLLREWEATSRIMDDLGGGYVSKDDVLDSIGFITDHELENYRQKAGANCLIDLYVWTGILETNEDGEHRVADVEPEPSDPEHPETPNESGGEESEAPAPEQPPQNTPNSGGRPDTPPDPPDFTGAPFDISLELTGDEDPDNVRELVVAVRAALEQEIDEEGDEPEIRSDGGKRPESNEDSSLDTFLDD